MLERFPEKWTPVFGRKRDNLRDSERVPGSKNRERALAAHKSGEPIRVLHIVPDLTMGGAEAMLQRLLSERSSGFNHGVISLRSYGDIGPLLKAQGIEVQALGIGSPLQGLAGLRRLLAAMSGFRPDIVHCWLYHGNLIGGLAARMATRAKVVWALHATWLDPSATRRLTRWIARACIPLSRIVPDRIVCCAETARQHHARLGYPDEKMIVIPNGVDTALFKPDPAARRQIRMELNIGEDQKLIGMVARLDPQKDHATFIRAASLLAAERPDCQFVLCGRGYDPANGELMRELERARLQGRFGLLGYRSDIPRLMAALDVLVLSSSYGEAAPLCILEALASGVPVVASDIGDCDRLIGKFGRLVPPKLPLELAKSIGEILALQPVSLELLRREMLDHVSRNYSLSAVRALYDAAYRETLALRGKDKEQRAVRPAYRIAP